MASLSATSQSQKLNTRASKLLSLTSPSRNLSRRLGVLSIPTQQLKGITSWFHPRGETRCFSSNVGRSPTSTKCPEHVGEAQYFQHHQYAIIPRHPTTQGQLVQCGRQRILSRHRRWYSRHSLLLLSLDTKMDPQQISGPR